MPETAIAPAPPKPAPTPAPAPAPTPSPTPAPKTAASAPDTGKTVPGKDYLGEAFSSLAGIKGDPDANANGNGKGQPATPPEPKTAEPAAVESKEPDGKTQLLSDEPEKMAPKALRQAYSNLKQELTRARAEVDTLKKAPKAPAADDPEKVELKTKYETTLKEANELRERMKFVAYEQSDEYKNRYVTPFTDAYAAGRDEVATLRVKGEDGSVRQATPEDFDHLMRISDNTQAAEFAQERFGPTATIALNHRAEVNRLNRSRLHALDEFKKTGTERLKQEAEAQGRFIEGARREINAFQTEAAERLPKWFKPTENDAEGNAALERGMADADKIVNLIFGDAGEMPPIEVHSRVAAFRNMAGAFPKLALEHHRMAKELESLKTKLKEYEDNDPTPGTRRPNGGTASAPGDVMAAALASMDSYRRK